MGKGDRLCPTLHRRRYWTGQRVLVNGVPSLILSYADLYLATDLPEPTHTHAECRGATVPHAID